MSPSASEGKAGAGGDRSAGLAKFIRRASKVLKPKAAQESGASTPAAEGSTPSAKSTPTSAPATAPAAAAVVASPRTAAARAPASSPLAEIRQPRVEVAPVPVATAAATPSSRQSAHDHAQALAKVREEKARALFAKYGMKLEASEWVRPATTPTTDWVEKKVVMRVHRQCHRCGTTYGAERVCLGCQHTRCKKCPRFPSKRTREQREADGPRLVVQQDPAQHARDLAQIKLTVPTRFNAEVVRKQPTQRVRRTCHKCGSLFKGQATDCESCKHVRCPQCPREPPKAKKYLNGYPGDVEEQYPLAQRTRKEIRIRYRWQCHTCQTFFIDHEKRCRSCEHERCDDCGRIPPKKPRKELAPEAVASLEQRLATVGISPAA